MFVIVRIRFLGKEKLEKLPGKLKNPGKTENAFFVNGWTNFANLTYLGRGT